MFNAILSTIVEDFMVNIIAGLVGAAIIGAVTFLIRLIQNKRFEDKFPISGKYISKYEDLEDGAIVVRSAPATFKQKGKKVTGETTFDGQRTWIMEGQVTDEGNFYGIYHAEDAHDQGVGNFFLKIDNKKCMSGIWSGYDSENDKVSAGNYTFRPVNENIQIVDLERKHIPAIIRIGDEEIGKDFVEMPILEDYLNKQDVFVGKVAVDTLNKTVVGFIFSYIIDKEQLIEIFNNKENKIPRQLLVSESYAYLKSTAVDKNYKGQSIGTQLVEATIEGFRALNVSTLFSTAWKSAKGTNMQGIFESLQFNEAYEIENYWREDSILKKYNCPVCGEPPCECSAVIYARFLI
ncbi:MAG TPA: GNAT family N-acetyltransferase [Bacilli bacterium]|nr:GNAT family N-acetyltransferase [Bacilli bacterium]